MTVKKCDKCGKIYEKGCVLSYSLDNYEVGKAVALLKHEYALTKDLCETCARRLKMFLKSRNVDKPVYAIHLHQVAETYVGM